MNHTLWDGDTDNSMSEVTEIRVGHLLFNHFKVLNLIL